MPLGLCVSKPLTYSLQARGEIRYISKHPMQEHQGLCIQNKNGWLSVLELLASQSFSGLTGREHSIRPHACPLRSCAKRGAPTKGSTSRDFFFPSTRQSCEPPLKALATQLYPSPKSQSVRVQGGTYGIRSQRNCATIKIFRRAVSPDSRVSGEHLERESKGSFGPRTPVPGAAAEGLTTCRGRLRHSHPT